MKCDPVADDAAARVCGKSMAWLQSNEHVFRPAIGVLSWRACREHTRLAALPNGTVLEPAAQTASSEGAADAEEGTMELDANHSHFLLVDGPAA